MKILSTDTRPARLAIAISEQATPRVARRAFRLLGGRWGGVHDLLLSIDPAAGPSELDIALLGAADPDYVVSIDPVLDPLDWSSILERADVQPFEILRLRERAESRGPWAHLFVESPTLFDEEEPRPPIVDLDHTGTSWRAAATAGFLQSHSSSTRVPAQGAPDDAVTPVVNSRAHLTAVNAGPKWLVVGPPDSLRVAADFWSLRALGARPTWRPETVLANERPPMSTALLVVHAPRAPASDMRKALTHWAANTGIDLHWSRQAPAQHVPAGRAYFSSAQQAVQDDDSLLLPTTPAPPPVDGRLRKGLAGVVEILIQSSDPVNPDGVMLTRNNASRRLLSADGELSSIVRVTRYGIAGALPIGKADLLAVPSISYRDAVAAPFIEGGYRISPSDKGRYQQRSLHLARGLRFLASCFTQKESSQLLDIFFEHHLGKSPPDLYRRAVTYEDL